MKEKKDDFLNLRISASDKKLLSDMAEEYGLSLSGFIMYLLKKEKREQILK